MVRLVLRVAVSRDGHLTGLVVLVGRAVAGVPAVILPHELAGNHELLVVRRRPVVRHRLVAHGQVRHLDAHLFTGRVLGDDPTLRAFLSPRHLVLDLPRLLVRGGHGALHGLRLRLVLLRDGRRGGDRRGDEHRDQGCSELPHVRLHVKRVPDRLDSGRSLTPAFPRFRLGALLRTAATVSTGPSGCKSVRSGAERVLLFAYRSAYPPASPPAGPRQSASGFRWNMHRRHRDQRPALV